MMNDLMTKIRRRKNNKEEQFETHKNKLVTGIRINKDKTLRKYKKMNQI